eukprot:756811-Hanusia_phi.AAC.10
MSRRLLLTAVLQLTIRRGPFHPKDRGVVQCLLAAATVPGPVRNIISSTFPRYREVQTQSAHKVSDRVFQEFVSVTAGDRAQTLLEVLDRGRRMNTDSWAKSRDLDKKARDATIIFCEKRFGDRFLADVLIWFMLGNTKDSAMFAAKLLRENDYDIAEGHGWVAQHERVVQINDFMSGKKKILVATDIIARGIDTVHVSHVINFDFPLNPVDYLHRIGRTGRGGGDASAVVFSPRLTPVSQALGE